MHRVIFIPQSRLGLLSISLEKMGDALTKRHRAAQHKLVAEVLRSLGLVERQADVHGLALGVDRSGERGLYIILDIPDHVLAANQQGDSDAVDSHNQE